MVDRLVNSGVVSNLISLEYSVCYWDEFIIQLHTNTTTLLITWQLATRTVTDNKEIIFSACELVDLLPESLHVSSDILDWFISHHLAEYKELFDPTQTTAWLDKIDQRYNWLRTNLVHLERLFVSVFPSSWLVTEKFLLEFCHITRTDLETVMKRRQSELTHNLIIFALQRTLSFESSLNKAYVTDALEVLKNKIVSAKTVERPSNPFDDESDADFEESPSKNVTEDKAYISSTNPPTNSWKKQTFDGIISGCFEQYFDLYLVHVDKALREQMTNRLIGDFTVNKSSLENRELGDVFKEDNPFDTIQNKMSPSDPSENTLYSATDLFLFYKQILKQTLQLIVVVVCWDLCVYYDSISLNTLSVYFWLKSLA
ncbi:unnamed protein product [Heterobilharzia americana]|nr:unnamed protein product [Heterobilharzia americana]